MSLSDYELIEKAIIYIENNYKQQPGTPGTNTICMVQFHWGSPYVVGVLSQKQCTAKESPLSASNVATVRYDYENGDGGHALVTFLWPKTRQRFHPYLVFRLWCYNKRSRDYVFRSHVLPMPNPLRGI